MVQTAIVGSAYKHGVRFVEGQQRLSLSSYF